MTKIQVRALLKEANRRKQSNQPNWYTKGFKAQNDFLDDSAPLIAVQCPRRSGKSYGAGLRLIKGAYENPRSVSLYMALTRSSAKNIMFDNILREIDRAYGLGATFNISDLSMTLSNGSKIVLMGVDTDEGQMNKILGGKYITCVVDEAAFFRINLSDLVYNILKPATMDYGDKGTIILISTTSDITNSLYYKIMHNEEMGWSHHVWKGTDNPFMKEKLTKEIAAMLERNPAMADTPGFKRMYLNEWAIDLDAKIYKLRDENVIKGLPATQDEWSYVIGIDLGWNDPTALVVCAYTDYDPNLYVVETFKKSKMTYDDVADKINELNDKYREKNGHGFHTYVIDGASKQGVETMRQRYSLPLTIAEKSGKKDHIELLNTDLASGKLLMLNYGTEELQEEMSELIWDQRKRTMGKWVEHASCANHLCDALLYAWWHSHNYRPDVHTTKIDPSSEKAVDLFWEKEEEKLERIANEDHDDDWLSEGFNTIDGDNW